VTPPQALLEVLVTTSLRDMGVNRNDADSSTVVGENRDSSTKLRLR
jgi:hypothetical protein